MMGQQYNVHSNKIYNTNFGVIIVNYGILAKIYLRTNLSPSGRVNHEKIRNSTDTVLCIVVFKLPSKSSCNNAMQKMQTKKRHCLDIYFRNA